MERTVIVTIKLSFKKNLYFMFHVRILVCVLVCMLPYTKMLYTWIGFLEEIQFLAQCFQLETRDYTAWEVGFEYNNAHGKVVV